MSLKLWVGWGGGDTKRRGRGELREEEREGGREERMGLGKSTSLVSIAVRRH